MNGIELHIASTLGLFLGVCLVAGVFAEFLHLPKVTAYLLVGLAMGPTALNVVPEHHVEHFEPLLKLAMALVLFNLGCGFTFARLKQVARQCIAVSAAEILCTFVVVAIGVVLFGSSVSTGILLGCLAVATAPATTILVLKELRSEGPVTESTGFLVAMNNFACIVMFEVGFLLVGLTREEVTTAPLRQLGYLLQNIAGSVLLGVVGGVVVSYGCGMLKTSRWLVLLVAAVTFLLGLCETFDIPYMLAFLVMGATVANTSDLKVRIVGELDHLSGLLAVLFFSVHGTELDLAALVSVGTIGMAYLACRALGKWLGVYAAARLTGQSPDVRQNLGHCLYAQAGAAIGLAAITVHREPELGKPIQDVILGAVVVFEIIGPLAIRQSLLRAGELPLSQAIHHTSSTPLEQVRALFDRFLTALGRFASNGPEGDELTVETILRRRIGLHESAPFRRIVAHIESSHDNTYPVVDDNKRVVGVLRYPQFSNVMYDNHVTSLVCAEDLATEANAILYPDDSINRANELFQQESDDCIPVVERDEPHALLGVVRRSDVIHALVTHRGSSKQ